MQDYPLILDTMQTGVQQTVTGFYCGDTGEKRLCITLLHQTNVYTPPTGTPVLCGKKPDGTRFLHPCTVSGSQVYYLPTLQTVAVPGTVECQLIVYGQNGSVLFAPQFAIEVEQPMQPNEGLASADEWSVLPMHVLSELSASNDGTLMLSGDPVNAVVMVETVDDLPAGYAGQLAYVRTGDGTNSLGFYCFDTQWTYLPASALEHTHTNKACLDSLHTENGFLFSGDTAVGRLLTAPRFADLPASCPDGTMAYIVSESSLFRKDTNGWYRIFNGRKEHAHDNKTTLDKISEQNGEPLFNGKPFIREVYDTLVPLALDTEYASLTVRTDWADVPVYVLGENETVARLVSDDTSEAGFAVSEVRLSYMRDYQTGMPVPILRVTTEGNVYTCYSALFHDFGATINPGWYDVEGTACSAPTLINMKFDALVIGVNERYTSSDVLTDEAQSALDTLSRMVNVSADAMGTLGIVENGVRRLTHAPQAGRTYYYATGSNLTLTLPAIPWTHDDLQLAIYLCCTADIDLTLPAGTRLIGGAPSTKAGMHKLIGICFKDANVWSVGGIDTEAAE